MLHRGDDFLIPLHLRSLFPSYRSSRPEVFCKKDDHFAKFLRKRNKADKVTNRTSLVLYCSCGYTEAYSESSRKSKMELSAVNYFRKRLHLRYSTGL